MSGTIRVIVPLPERAHARLSAEAARNGTSVRLMLQQAAQQAAEGLPDPPPIARRMPREELVSRVLDLRAADLDDDEIAHQLQVPVERVQAVR